MEIEKINYHAHCLGPFPLHCFSLGPFICVAAHWWFAGLLAWGQLLVAEGGACQGSRRSDASQALLSSLG
jgi:hypothetical protein